MKVKPTTLVERFAALVEEWLPRCLLSDYRVRVYDSTHIPSTSVAIAVWDSNEKSVTFELYKGLMVEKLLATILHELAHGVLIECGFPPDGDYVEKLCDRLAEIWERMER